MIKTVNKLNAERHRAILAKLISLCRKEGKGNKGNGKKGNGKKETYQNLLRTNLLIVQFICCLHR